MTTLARSHAPIVAALAGLVAVIAWLILASTTHLIFHLMPAGAPLAGALVIRAWGDPNGGRGATLTTLGSTILLAAGGAIAVEAAGLPTDGVAAIAATIGLGGVVAAWLLRSFIR